MYTLLGDGKELIWLLMILAPFAGWWKIYEKMPCLYHIHGMDVFEPNLHLSCITLNVNDYV